MNDSIWIRVPIRDIGKLESWAVSCKIGYAIGPTFGEPFHIVRITSKDPKIHTMACIFGEFILSFNSKDMYCK